MAEHMVAIVTLFFDHVRQIPALTGDLRPQPVLPGGASLTGHAQEREMHPVESGYEEATTYV